MAEPRTAPRRAAAPLLAVLLAGSVLVGATPSEASTAAWTTVQAERYVFCRINDVRAAHGVPRLQLDHRASAPGTTTLQATARTWSARQVDLGRIAHTPVDRVLAELSAVDPAWTTWAENIGQVQPWEHPESSIARFLASNAHRDNLLRRDANRVGVGAATRPDGTVVLTIRFMGSPNDTPVPRDAGTTGCSDLPTGSVDGTRPFADVAPNAYFTAGVRYLADRAITTGCAPGHFCPHWPVTRAQSITFLHRLAGRPSSDAPAFADVPGSSWYATSTRWGRAAGITTGVGGTNLFDPHSPASRAELVAMIHRFAGHPSPAGSVGFSDVPRSAYYADAVSWAREQGVTTGVGGSDRFEPHRPVSRGEAAAMLVRYAKGAAARDHSATPLGV